jgi:hypothetical protein
MTLTALSILLALVTAAPQPQRPKASGLVLGRVIDVKSGRPIAGAIVSLFGSASVPSPPRAGASAPRVMTNIDGQFVVRGLRKGTLFLVVTKGGYVDAMNGQRRPGGSGQPLQISDGQRITDVELRMWKYAVISGSVVDEAGEPIIGARVQAYARTFVAGRPRFTPSVAGSTDDRGMYRLAGLTPGDYRVAVTSSLVTLPTSVMDTLLQGTGDRAARRELAHDAGAISCRSGRQSVCHACRNGDDLTRPRHGKSGPTLGREIPGLSDHASAGGARCAIRRRA